MFTGIIQTIAKIKNITNLPKGKRFEVDVNDLLKYNLEIGESIAINGSCHTIESLNNNFASFFSSQETLNKTNLNFIKIGDFVNLELAVSLNQRLGGHLVSGHVDCLAKFLSFENQGQAYLIYIEIIENIAKYIVNKGSVCLNGISLTVANIEKNSNVFSVAVIPHTWNNTNLKYLKTGDLLNFEADMIGKYIEKFLNYKLTD